MIDEVEYTQLPDEEEQPLEPIGQVSLLDISKDLAEQIWPYRNSRGEVEEPTFDEYLKWLAELDQKRLMLAGLNMPRSFLPRPYQVEGAVHLRSAPRGRMIYDQPGLGKTLQAAMALTPPCIISCPGYLVDQWADFLENQYPQWRVARIHALLWRHQRQELLDAGPYSERNPKGYHIWIVNHEMWANRKEPFRGGKEPKPKYSDEWYDWSALKVAHDQTAKSISYKWPRVHTLILDESHHFRNREASQSQGVANYADTADQVFLLTGTPQYRDAKDWWHQLRIMDPLRFKSFKKFADEYLYMGGPSGNICKVYTWKVEDLQHLIAEYAVGRTYKEVGLFLPDIIEYTVRIPWHKDLYAAYKMIKENMRINTNDGYSMTVDPGQQLHLLREMTAGAPEKVNAIKTILEDIPDTLPNGQPDESPIIVFCWYRDSAEALAGEFALSPTSVRIHGGYTQRERVARATDPTHRMKCVTMASASEGLDWSDANVVIFFEEDYIPGKIYQALSRIRRWSKNEEKRPILVYYLHMKDSVDEAVHEAVTERQGDARKILRRALK